MKNSVKQPNALDLEIGTRIAALRMSKGITRLKLAEELGITQQQLQKYEKGINRISVGRLVEISHALNTSILHVLENHVQHINQHDTAYQRMALEMMHYFHCINSHDQRVAVYRLVKSLADESTCTK